MSFYPIVQELSILDLLRLMVKESAKEDWPGLISRFGSPEALAIWLAQASVEEISALRGIGPGKAEKLKAAIELGRRLSSLKRPHMAKINTPEDVAKFMEEMSQLDREYFKVILLSTKNDVLGVDTISIGGLSGTFVHPRETFKIAIRASAAAIIAVHNHPSGDPSPSSEDINTTKRLKEAGKFLGISLVDHIIIGKRGFVSLREQGFM